MWERGIIAQKTHKLMNLFGHVQRRDAGCIIERMLKMELIGKRKCGRPKRRFIYVVRADIRVLGMTEDDKEVSRRWERLTVAAVVVLVVVMV